MSVLDRLKAIRGRLSTQAEETATPQQPQAAAFPVEDDPDAGDGLAGPSGPLDAGRPINMWDLAVAPDSAEDREEPRAVAAVGSGSTLVRFPTAATAPETPRATASAGWPGETAWPPTAPPAAEAAPRAATPAWPPYPGPGGGRGEPEARRGRVKTRILGFDHSNGASTDLSDPPAEPTAQAEAVPFPVGWLVVTAGPGRGTAFALGTGVSQIGRGEDQAVRLDFGDATVSRAGHAAIAFDDESRAFFIGHGGKSNLVRLNGRPLLSTETLGHGDQIQIGETTLRLVALCGDQFSWAEEPGKGSAVSG